MGPTPKEKEKKKNKIKTLKVWAFGGDSRERLFLVLFFFINIISQILEFLSVRIRRDKHGKCSTRRELRVSTRNTRFH